MRPATSLSKAPRRGPRHEPMRPYRETLEALRRHLKAPTWEAQTADRAEALRRLEAEPLKPLRRR